jgi:hypothetical protein
MTISDVVVASSGPCCSKWGDRHYPTPGGPPRLTLHTGCGGSVGVDLQCDRCGEQVLFGQLDLPLGPGSPRNARAAT